MQNRKVLVKIYLNDDKCMRALALENANAISKRNLTF